MTPTRGNNVIRRSPLRLEVHNSRAPARHSDYISYSSGAYFKIKIYRTIILLVVLYGCETWSLTLREERRLRVFENRVEVKQSHYRPGQTLSVPGG